MVKNKIPNYNNQNFCKFLEQKDQLSLCNYKVTEK